MPFIIFHFSKTVKDHLGQTVKDHPILYNGIAPYFSNNDFSMEDIENYHSDTLCFYEKDGNYYNILIEDKDGDEATANDKQLVLYEFIRNKTKSKI
jgi:uncharacterized protein (DUF427 family)